MIFELVFPANAFATIRVYEYSVTNTTTGASQNIIADSEIKNHIMLLASIR